MKNTLQWKISGQEFEDGSLVTDWKKIESNPWHLQIESQYEMTFDIYEHDGQFWKLYQARWVIEGTTEYLYRYGGQACRMTQVQYRQTVRSPHSGLLKQAGDLEWVRVYEVDERIHQVMQTGKIDLKYDNSVVVKRSI
ncbi:MAG: hypothetical protein AAF579_15185 [Cyanobacteria bacterium P01_C01_bin.118]